MSTKKTDVEQLKGILEQFSQETIQEALGTLPQAAYPIKSYKDFDDPGPEVEVGKDNRVAIEDMGYLERIIAEPNFLPAHFLEEGAVVQKAIARVTLTESNAGLPAGSGWGTGFLVSPSLFMTNNHVIPSEAFARKVEMQFNYQLDHNGNPQTVDVYSPDPDDVFYTNAPLDFTLIRLNPRCRFLFQHLQPSREGLEFDSAGGQDMPAYMPNPLAHEAPVRPIQPLVPGAVDWYRPRPVYKKVCITPGQVWGQLQLREAISYAGPSNGNPGQHINIIQHPQGRRKEVSLQENNLTNIYQTRVRYTSDTEPGSSGSAVFNNQWDLIALHHAAGERDSTGAWISNEGMRIDKIVADLKNHFNGSTTGNQILTELGI